MSENRPKLDLQLNQPTELSLLFDSPLEGESKYGKYYMYAVRDKAGNEYTFFAPDPVHEEIKNLKKNNSFLITKQAEQQGNKIITKFDVSAIPTNGKSHKNNGKKDSLYELLLKSYQDGLKISETLNGMVDVNKVAITLFIARSKLNGGAYDTI